MDADPLSVNDMHGGYPSAWLGYAIGVSNSECSQRFWGFFFEVRRTVPTKDPAGVAARMHSVIVVSGSR
jgi:hypothetical protein